MSETLDGILNWRIWSDKVSLSGQPSDAELGALSANGVEHIINLGPHTDKGALPDEKASVAKLGMAYSSIPVAFEAPTLENFQTFDALLDRLPEARLHIHCIYNARVSAFMFKRVKRLNTRPVDAFRMMDGIWRPGTVWAEFLGIEPTANGRNQYAGYDY